MCEFVQLNKTTHPKSIDPTSRSKLINFRRTCRKYLWICRFTVVLFGGRNFDWEQRM